ncbi:MAG: cell division protein ZapA [Methyloligellaceae bacterium]
MGQVAITLNGRTYRLECDDGEEQHLLRLSELIGRHIEDLKQKFGQIGDDRLMLMAALMIADDYWEVRSKLDEIEQEKLSADEIIRNAQASVAGQIEEAAQRIEALNSVLSEAPEPELNS